MRRKGHKPRPNPIARALRNSTRPSRITSGKHYQRRPRNQRSDR